jgi:hypothetical protein
LTIGLRIQEHCRRPPQVIVRLLHSQAQFIRVPARAKLLAIPLKLTGGEPARLAAGSRYNRTQILSEASQFL